jgi:uncharacterized membrane protein YgdD (TMEM256/DUF423 family)
MITGKKVFFFVIGVIMIIICVACGWFAYHNIITDEAEDDSEVNNPIVLLQAIIAVITLVCGYCSLKHTFVPQGYIRSTGRRWRNC